MAELITLEGEKSFPIGTEIVSVSGKFYPREVVNGELSGNLVLDSAIVKYPYITELNGSDMEDISLNGDVVYTDFILPADRENYPDVTLSGEEYLNGFGFGKMFGRGGLGKAFSGLSRGLSRSGRSLSRGLSRSGRSLSRGLSRSGRSLSRGLSRSASSFSRGLSRGANQFVKAHTDVFKAAGKGLSSLGKNLSQGLSSLQPSGGAQEEVPEEITDEEQLDINQIEEQAPIEDGTDEQIPEEENLMEQNSEIQSEEPDSPPEISGWGDIAQGLSQTAGQVPHPYGQAASLGLNILSQFDNKKKPSQNVLSMLQKLRSAPKKSKPVMVKKPSGQTVLKMKTGTPSFLRSGDTKEKSGSLMDNKPVLIVGAIAVVGGIYFLSKGKKGR